MLLKPCRISTDRFTVVDRHQFVAELSDLGQPLGRVWDDACDTGLTLVSSRTGNEIVFAVEHIESDPREGELLWLDLVPAERRYQELGLTVRLFND